MIIITFFKSSRRQYFNENLTLNFFCVFSVETSFFFFFFKVLHNSDRPQRAGLLPPSSPGTERSRLSESDPALVSLTLCVSAASYKTDKGKHTHRKFHTFEQSQSMKVAFELSQPQLHGAGSTFYTCPLGNGKLGSHYSDP